MKGHQNSSVGFFGLTNLYPVPINVLIYRECRRSCETYCTLSKHMEAKMLFYLDQHISNLVTEDKWIDLPLNYIKN